MHTNIADLYFSILECFEANTVNFGILHPKGIVVCLNKLNGEDVLKLYSTLIRHGIRSDVKHKSHRDEKILEIEFEKEER